MQATKQKTGKPRAALALEEISMGNPSFRAFMMKQRGYEGRMGSTLLMETPEGVVITGDLCPRANTRGVISDLGYNLGWFAGTSSADYLASKFLEKGWHAELAQRDMEVMAKAVLAREYDDAEWAEILDGDDPPGERRRELAKQLRSLGRRADDMGGVSFMDEYHTEIHDDFEDTPGVGYDPDQLKMLCIIQSRFSVLYNALPDRENSDTAYGAALEKVARLAQEFVDARDVDHRVPLGYSTHDAGKDSQNLVLHARMDLRDALVVLDRLKPKGKRNDDR